MMYEQAQKDIKKLIQGMAGKYSTYNIFKDFIVLSACTISNHCDMSQWEKREKIYMDIIKKYNKKEANKFAEMLGLTVLAYERRMGDFIGELYMTMEFGNKDSGQFFTPYDVSRMMAQMVQKEPESDGIVKFNDPACGSGGLTVAYAEQMMLSGHNYQTDLRVICNDIDYDVVKMCYIQLSLLGIDAVVEQRNTLAPLDKPPGEIWYTPMHVMNRVRESQNEKTRKMVKAMREAITTERKQKKEPERELVAVGEQVDIFDILGGWR